MRKRTTSKLLKRHTHDSADRVEESIFILRCFCFLRGALGHQMCPFLKYKVPTPLRVWALSREKEIAHSPFHSPSWFLSCYRIGRRTCMFGRRIPAWICLIIGADKPSFLTEVSWFPEVQKVRNLHFSDSRCRSLGLLFHLLGEKNLQKDAEKHKHYYSKKDTFPTFFFDSEFYSARSLKSQIEHKIGNSVAGLVAFH